MPKDPRTKTQNARDQRGSSAEPHAQRIAETINLIEIRSGLFINVDHIVSMRVLAQEESDVYAVLRLSNGDTLNLTRGEFSTVSGEEPRQPAR